MSLNLAVTAREFSAKLSSLIRPETLGRKRLAVSVSGGADSMALCTLLREHRQLTGWPTSLFAYTIDHGVRPESAEEAKTVSGWVSGLGFKHNIIALSVPFKDAFKKRLPPNIETQLRMERYKQLIAAAKEDDVGAILTAHHDDDQYETIIIRMSSGSGLAGLAGIPEKNGFFVRPLLDYPKARLMLTCLAHNTPWVEDSTNFDPTFATRNAIRKMVQNQNDLPKALQKESLIALSKIGIEYRDKIIGEVNSLLRKCQFFQDPFTKSVRVTCPKDFDLNTISPRVLRMFLPTLARILQSSKLQEFVFLGISSDLASKQVLEQFLIPTIKRFSFQNILFHKFINPDSSISILLYHEGPRKADTKRMVNVEVENSIDTWKKTHFDIPLIWPIPGRFELYVSKDQNYYIRHFKTKEDKRLIEKVGTKEQAIFMKNAKARTVFYPRELFPVICHKEGHDERVDAIPHFHITLNPDVKVMMDEDVNMRHQKSKWIPMRWEDDTDPQKDLLNEGESKILRKLARR